MATDSNTYLSSALQGARYLEVSAAVRYWDDATVNECEDTDGTLIPLRRGDDWCPIIDLDTGRILGWPVASIANIHYKVCDAGEYWLLNAERERIAKWGGHYVPDKFLCPGTNGYGDYIILTVNNDGSIADWERPEIDAERWRLLT